MLTPENLIVRLGEWSKNLPAQLPKALSPEKTIQGSPILLYQAFYTLLHELKTSVSLSDSAEIRALSATVSGLEKDLKRLAYDEIELTETDNAALLDFAKGFTSVSELKNTIAGLLTKAQRTPEKGSDAAERLLSTELPWDSLSRARAKSAARHGYTFWSKNDSCELSTLLAQHEKITNEIIEMSGVPILRKLDSQQNDSASQMQLLYAQYAAFWPIEPVTRIVETLRWVKA